MEDKIKANLVCIVNDGSIEDSDLKAISQPFIIGNIISETDKDIEVEFEFNKKGFKKKIRKQNVKKLFSDPKDLESAELDKIKEINPLDCLINITNRIASKKFFNFVDDGFLLLYENYSEKDFNEFEFSTLNEQSQFNITEKSVVLSSILKTFEMANFYEIYMKIIDKYLKKNENLSFFFLSNQKKDEESPSKNKENVKYLLKNLSVYNKIYFPVNNFENTTDQNNTFNFIDKVYQAIELLDIFGSSSVTIKDKQALIVQPNFLYGLIIYYNKKYLIPRGAKLSILAFNKFFLDINSKKLINQRSFQSFYALLRGSDSQLLESLDLNSKIESYKILNKTDNSHWEVKEDLNNYKILNKAFKTFNFSSEEISYINRTLALILHIGNIEFDKNNNEVSSVKNIKPVRKAFNLKDEKELETLERSFLNKIILNSQHNQTFIKFKIDEANNNLNLIIQNLYEKLFNFIVEKINKSLFNENIITKQSIEEKIFKEVSIVDVSNNSIFFSSSNLFNLLHFYVSEKSYELIEKVKISNMLKTYDLAKLKKSKINYSYDVTFENIFKFFEGPKNGLLKLLNENLLDLKMKESDFLSKLELNKNVTVSNNINYYNLCFKHLEGEYNFNLSEIIENNSINDNQNLIYIFDLMVNNMKSSNEDIFKIYFQQHGQNTFFNLCIDNFSNFMGENNNSRKIFVCSIPQSNFETNLDELMKKPKSLIALNQIRKFRIESYVENILNRYFKSISYKDFCVRYECLYDDVNKNKPDFNSINKFTDNDSNLIGLTKALIKGLNLEDNGIYLGENYLILLTNYVYNNLEEKLNTQNKLSEKAGLKLFSILKMIKLKKYVKKLTSATIKIQKKFKNKLKENSKRFLSMCQLKIHYWFISRLKYIRMKKMRWNVVKIQRLIRSFVRRKVRTRNIIIVDYKNWNLENYIKIEEKLVKPKYEYGKFNFTGYVSGMVQSALSKCNKVVISEFIREEQYQEIRKKNALNFNPSSYVGSLIGRVINKIEYENKLENEHNPQIEKLVKKEVKQEKKTNVNQISSKQHSENKNNIKIHDKKEDIQINKIKKLQPKNENINKTALNEKFNKGVKEIKKPTTKSTEQDKRKTENLNVIREEIKAEDSEKREPSSEDKILKIQGKWKSKRASKWIDVLRDKVFIIQRNFRKLLIKKYDLPDNYFYNEVFLRKQLEIFEKNVMENMKVLFPAIFENEQEKQASNEIPEEELGKKDFIKTKNSKQKYGKNEEINLKTQSKLITEKSFVNSHLKNEINKNSLIHNPYEDGKLHLFANILDIDFMVETDEVYEKLWATSYHKVFTNCLNNNAPLQLLSLGSSHTVCLSNKGKAYSFGWNNFGQCGVPVKSTIISKRELEGETEEEKKRKSEFSVSKNLKVINKVEGMKIPQIEELLVAKSVACGEDHTLLLDNEGEVWCFGINLNGQLGLGHKNLVEKPSKLIALSKLKINSIKTEGEVNFAVSSFGDAYMWPWNDINKLRYDPLKISLKNEKVATVSCGNNFVLLLCQSGKLYSMGKTNNYGQLGLGDTNPRYRPTLVEFFVINQERVTQLSCGYKHAACKTSTGRVYTWGLGVKGQLGHGDFNNYSLPHQIVFENNQFIKALQVSCGFRSTFFLLENRKIFFSGCTSNTFMQNYPILYNYIQKIPELKNESNYSIVRILTTWTKSFSILYATIADSTTMKISPIKLNSILTNLASKWENEYVDPPYIDAIAGYFSSSYMRKNK